MISDIFRHLSLLSDSVVLNSVGDGLKLALFSPGGGVKLVMLLSPGGGLKLELVEPGLRLGNVFADVLAGGGRGMPVFCGFAVAEADAV
jgi:hypothetical protein